MTQNVIKIARRKDIEVLVSLYEQGAQLLQVRADGFEDGADGGINFMIPIAEKYLKDEVEKEDLKQLRNDMLAKTTYKQRLLDITREKKKGSSKARMHRKRCQRARTPKRTSRWQAEVMEDDKEERRKNNIFHKFTQHIININSYYLVQ